jgi:AMMECR1 domain-containing protein
MARRLHPVVKLAKKTVESYVREGKMPKPRKLTPEMRERAGVFVSLHRHGQLRGCIGTFEPAKDNVAEEIIANAISSSTGDPRFPPVTVSELDHKEYGVIVESDWRKGLLLPDLEGVDSVEEQIAICRLKAGISADEPVRLYRFQVRRFQ